MTRYQVCLCLAGSALGEWDTLSSPPCSSIMNQTLITEYFLSFLSPFLHPPISPSITTSDTGQVTATYPQDEKLFQCIYRLYILLEENTVIWKQEVFGSAA